MTISIPRDLKRSMEKCPTEVNWSAVAARAVEQKVAADIATKREKNMEDVIQRLRASKSQGESDSFDLGKVCGESWARDSAEFDELKRVSKLVLVDGLDNWFWTTEERDFASLIEQVSPGTEADDDMLNVWVGEDNKAHCHDQQFIRGFCAGALVVWDAVEGKV